MKLHPFIKMSGCKSEEEFNRTFPTEKDFFKKYPNAKYHLANGQANVEQNQSLPPDRSVLNQFKNTEETKKAIPKSKEYKKGGECMECGGKHMYQTGGPMTQWDDMQVGSPGYQDLGSMYTVAGWPGLLHKPQQGLNTQPTYNFYNEPQYSDVSSTGYIAPTKALGMDSSSYSIDRIREQEMKMGGKKRYQRGGMPRRTDQPFSMQDYGATQSSVRSAAEQAGNNPYAFTGTPNQAQGNPFEKLYGTYDINSQNQASEASMSQPGINPWGVGGGILAMGAGAIAGYAAIDSSLQKQGNQANARREQGLSSNMYASQNNPVDAWGGQGIVGQGYGMQGINQMNPTRGGNKMYRHGGGHGTWDGTLGVYYQMGGEVDAGLEPGMIVDLPEDQIRELIKKGYKVEPV